MAVTPAGAALTRQHRQTQAAIRSLTLQRLLPLWRLLDPARLDATSPGYLEAAVALVRGGHALSARAAASYYLAFRVAEGLTAGAPPLPPPPLDVDRVRTSLIVTGPVEVKRATGMRVPLGRAVDTALTMTSGAVARHVAAGGWDTVQGAVRSDRQARGWARVASGNACAFCLMLASRGPVYRGEDTASFEPHDHCSCGIEPVLGDGYQWPETSVAAREQWDALKDENGGDGADLNSFRRALAAAE